MGKREVFLLLLLSSASFALIDPPVDSVYQHNVAVASSLNGILSQNLLNCTERVPDINDPASFFCVKALTLTPSVNYTVTAALHPKLVWAIAENHNQTFRTNWTTDPDCSESWRQRTYGDVRLENAKAAFTVDGLLDNESGNYTYMTANASEDLLSFDPLSNVSTQLSIIDVPFKKDTSPLSKCNILSFISQFILGGFFNLNCYEPSLDRASPYAAGVYNLTVRNQTIVTPHLNVTVSAEIEIPYTETGQDCYKGAKGCTCDSVSDEGNATFWASDFASYEVQNQYMTFIPYMPAFLNYSANTTENAAFHFSVFSNSELYKYYFVMDNQTATAYYMYDFVVQNDSTGIETIIAVPNGTIGAVPGDPGALENYTGSHLLFLNVSGNVLREPYEMNNLSYNYSKVYDLMEIFSNLSSGLHHANLEFFTFFGNQTVPYNISVRARTILVIGAGAGSANNTVDVNCLLTSRGVPVPGQEVELSVGDQTQVAVTDSTGMCPIETFQAAGRIGKAYGQFAGTPDMLPTDNYANYVLGSPFSFGTDFIGNNFGLMLVLSVLLAFSTMELLGFLAMGPVAGGATMGMVMDKFYPYKPDVGKAIAKGINSYTKQVGKAVGKAAVAVAVAAATVVTGGAAAPAAGAAAGGAGATAGTSGAAAGGAAGSAAAQAAAKEAARKAAADSLKDRAMKEMSEKAGKKWIEKDGLIKKPTSKKGGFGPPSGPGKEKDIYSVFRDSAKKVDKELRGEVAKSMRRIAAEETQNLKLSLKLNNPEDKRIYEEIMGKMNNTKVYVVDQKTWDFEFAKQGNFNPPPAFRPRGSTEIYICEDDARDSALREKRLRHELDHVVSEYTTKWTREAHANLIAFDRIQRHGIRIQEGMLSYEYETKSLMMLTDLAGENALKNHSAYVGAEKELGEKIINEHEGKMEDLNGQIKSITETMNDFYTRTPSYSEREYRIIVRDTFYKVDNLYKTLKPERYDEMKKKMDGIYG